MSLSSVTHDLSKRAPHLTIVETDAPTPTVQTAADVHGVAPAQIAKTLAFWVDNGGEKTPVLIVAGGVARMDNAKVKRALGGKAKMLNAEEVLVVTSHPVGGVCPFGLPSSLKIYLDESLKQFDELLPAAGSVNSAVRVSLSDLAHLTQGEWVDVAKEVDAEVVT